MNDYELYRILEANGYDTTNENLAILKEGLESGEIMLNEKKQPTAPQTIKQLSADQEKEDDTKKGKLKKIAKIAGRTLGGAVIGAGLGGTAGALIGQTAKQADVDIAQKAISTAKQAPVDSTLRDKVGTPEDAASSGTLYGDLTKAKEAQTTARKTGTRHGFTVGAVGGAAAAQGIGKAADESNDKSTFRTINKAKKKLHQYKNKHSNNIDYNELVANLAESSDEELRDLLSTNGFESDDDNIATLRENGALILSTDDIVLTEGMSPEYALMKLLDANGFEPTAENIRILNAGLESGSILLN